MIAGHQDEVVAFLSTPSSYPHPVERVSHLETHISHIFLTGPFAYKLKKPVKFDFLDFSRPEDRLRYCEDERRMSSRFAPDLYVGVLAIRRAPHGLAFGELGELVDAVVKMRQFDNETLFDRLAEQGTLTEGLLLEITDRIASFHLSATPQPSYWSASAVAEAIARNLAGLDEFVPALFRRDEVNSLRKEFQNALRAHSELLERRRVTHVRELHGDLHLRNMCVLDGRAQLFDGIEFNPTLSNCDTWADLSFFIMDLVFRGLGEAASLVWNRYLLQTDDFEGLELLPLYLAYRASIRARISALEMGSSAPNVHGAEAQRYLQLALAFLRPPTPALVCVGGLSGSGKSTLSALLSKKIRAVHVRSDAIRKHLVGCALTERAPETAYGEETTRATYRGAFDRARHALRGGQSVIVDATFSSEADRQAAERLADEERVPFFGFWCEVSAETARERIRARRNDISDADEVVLAGQIARGAGDVRWKRIDSSRDVGAAVEEMLDRSSLRNKTDVGQS